MPTLKRENMFSEKNHLSYDAENSLNKRAFYMPFYINDNELYKFGVIDRNSSSEYISLNGKWEFCTYKGINNIDINVSTKNKVQVPCSIQLQGYDQIQYLNERYPIPYNPPYVPNDTPIFHYRKKIKIDDVGHSFYLNFDGVDSGFYLYVNKAKVGYGQISHAHNEFDITNYIKNGVNIIDVIVLKWCVGTYLECQDKFRLSGIFRDVYILKRPKIHITDYSIKSFIEDGYGIIEIENKSKISINFLIDNIKYLIADNTKKKIVIKNPKLWSAENPYLYDVLLYTENEKIFEKIGIRNVEIVDGIFKVNGKHIKLKGVNRHEFDCKKGATISIEQTEKDIKLLKSSGFNAIRTAHYPDIPEFYFLCDLYGIYVIDEADFETHGAFNVENNLGYRPMKNIMEDSFFEKGVFNREVSLYERDKNRTCVIIWSIGNESSFGKNFFSGIEYIKLNDNRPIHYQGVAYLETKDEYYSDKFDIIGVFYPKFDFFDEYLNDEKEKRPLLLTEYLHAMGNSCGSLKEYWEKIYSNDRFMGAFVWEFNDHAILTKKGYMYGGDFNESEHDSNFCVDGLVGPQREIKSNFLEVRSLYLFDKLKQEEVLKSELEKTENNFAVKYKANDDGYLLAISNFKFEIPFKINIIRAYLDNDIHQRQEWSKYEDFTQQILDVQYEKNKTIYFGCIVANTLKPIIDFKLEYYPTNNGVDIFFEYKVADYVSFLPRIGFEFALKKKYSNFQYDGFGESESYIDKHLSSDYGRYTSNAYKNMQNYIMPQECGSHYNTTALSITNLLSISAEKPFSFSVLPYSTKELLKAKHSFELKKSKLIYINLDLFMSGVGTASCGPELLEKYRVPKTGKNTFRLLLK